MSAWVRTGIEGNALAAAQSANPGTEIRPRLFSWRRCPDCRAAMHRMGIYSPRNKWGHQDRLVGCHACQRCGAVTDDVEYI